MTHSCSYVYFSSSVMEEQQMQLEEIVNVVVNPLVTYISETSSLLSTTDQDVYCLVKKIPLDRCCHSLRLFFYFSRTETLYIHPRK